ncbi:ABC transporter permease/substrate-binding protein [Lentilactobacillus otakiensis]|uniref:Glycine betaine ABC transporter periplasmic protein n=1 Tax=Lentilactobacillus otakiensis DSM 19908 = JCM 15040 TaxID=1423780 RepID=S4PQ08_9LACO|nr:ABC transporter permease/substrate-binding protein [Lentilactobacillus otakiensis]KRL11588.1 glycine betaine ABC transporter periplasmic protein [Lentilactobacillus otakiensis DSM 19908 = JCM 15040]MBZ3776790.1 ABC transporter permease/substrate-binding protein [Lentilactobacillus otakiensis]MDV3519321.1 ABC transporter permease/substrate-binding protein [Lentilactobacillus otakiensis]GAD16810.1 glycine betaine ABC transporter periplasmic protein [Lentilactobacillus otakiensis DSM 19908 = JC
MVDEVSTYISKNAGAIIQALWQHVEISLIAIIITIVIAIPLAIALVNRPKIGEVISQLAGVIQTIPSLAVLGILIPFVGIGIVPAIIALVLYAIMPIFQNTYAGLTHIDPVLLEAADALGVTKRFKLFRIELPLAMPMILSGIRIATVLVIGTATLAALIGGGGLGTYILLGIQTNNNAALIVGAVLSAVLALLASWLIKALSKTSFKKLGIGVLAILVFGGGVLGWSLFDKPAQTITIAGKMGGEPEILINMYKDLVEQDNPRTKVQLKPNFGGTSFLFKALQSGQIDVYPEFTGTVLQSLVHSPKKVDPSPKLAYRDAKVALNQKFHLHYLKPMAYQNGYAITVRKATADKYHLRTIADLQRVGNRLNGAFDPDFYQQSDGYPGLQQAYQFKLKSARTMEPSLRYVALADGRVDVTDAYTTDPQIKEYHLVVLKDSKKFFPPYQGAPMMTNEFAKSHPDVVRSLSRLSGKITTSDMQEMNYQVTVKHRNAADVAKEYLQAHHLLD